MTKRTILERLNGRESPERGLTAEELAEMTHAPIAVVRNALAELVFTHSNRVSVYGVTCDREGRHYMGDPTLLYDAGPLPKVPVQ